MKKTTTKKVDFHAKANENGEKGSAIVIALFVLALISVFVALAMTRSASEAAATGNETAEGRTFYAAQGSLETMTRNFNKVFEVKLNPSTADLNLVRNGAVNGLGAYTFVQELEQTSARTNVVLSGGPFTGLYAIRDNWRLRTTTTNNVGVQVQLTRNVLNNRVPIFQFGIFYEDDLELYRPPRFSFGGRVHSNRHFFVSPGPDGVYFDSRVTAVGHIITQSWRNHWTGDSAYSNTFIKNASAVDKQLLPAEGSVLNTTAGAADNIFAAFPDLPPSRLNPDFAVQSAIFDGNLRNLVPQLKLPVKIDNANADLVDMIRRGKKVADAAGGDLYRDASGVLSPVLATTADSDILREERFANKTGIRISLSDSKAKLPGCASGTGTAAIAGPCGIRLDGHQDPGNLGIDPVPSPAPTPLRVRGYKPKGMKMTTVTAGFTYIPTRVNGERLYQGSAVAGRQVWIKVETVVPNLALGTIDTRDITQDFLSMGVTEQPPVLAGVTYDGYDETPPDNRTDLTTRNINMTTAQPPTGGNDSRSVIKIQRFAIPGPPIPGTAPNAPSVAPATRWLYPYANYNFVVRCTGTIPQVTAGCTSIVPGYTTINDDPNGSNESLAHLLRLGTSQAIVPFPIQLFDTRESIYYDWASTAVLTDPSRLTRNGVMSLVDIDVANLRRFLRGDFNGLFPIDTPFAASKGNVGLVSGDIPQREGWVLYFSDRRGDADFDGEFDMEDIYSDPPGNTGTMQPGEDFNGNGVLDTSYGTEAERYNTNTITPDGAAVTDHKYFRRGMRLINATTLPGVFDAVTAANTRGFTVASENGIYVQGNYNATGVASIPVTGNTVYSEYLPFDSPTHIPASIVGDGVIVLSNLWNDAQSFSSPYAQSGRLAGPTTVRFAMISGDTIASKAEWPHQGGVGPRMNGGVHNFKRFLERWTEPGNPAFSVNLNYAGSLINLYNSRNNAGSFKCCSTVYNPPVRNWVFDSTFLDPTRLPPGTPFFQYVQTTGFQRTND